MSLWFSASAVVPALRLQVGLDDSLAALFTSAVQAGFVFGTLLSAGLGLADRLDPRRLMAACALIGAMANAVILVVPPDSHAVMPMRFITGMAMAGVYPVGVRIAASWARNDMGLMVGLVAGALTLGASGPHLFNGLGGIDWRLTVGLTSLAALAAAVGALFIGLGPAYARAPRFLPRMALKAWTDPTLRLTNFGYFGHMWELYAMWAWIGLFIDASFRAVPDRIADPASSAAYVTAASVALGGVLCVVGGRIADQVGRTTLSIGAMAVSGACALTIGFTFGGPPWAVILVSLIWGATVSPDSPQFSAATAELAPRELIGTMVTVQTCLGFLLTLVTIHLIPPLVSWVGWDYAFTVLALGPLLGIRAMWRLRRHPDATRLAGGNR